MKPFIALLLAWQSTISIGFAQESSIIYSDQSISISSMRQTCVDERNGIEKEFVMLSITNSSDAELSIRAKKETWYNSSCVTCGNDAPEFYLNLTVQGNSTVEGTCDTSTDNLRVFASMPNISNARKLNHFELKDIQITEN